MEGTRSSLRLITERNSRIETNRCQGSVM